MLCVAGLTVQSLGDIAVTDLVGTPSEHLEDDGPLVARSKLRLNAGALTAGSPTVHLGLTVN